MFSFFNYAADWANNTGFGGWRLSNPNEYKFTFKSNTHRYNNQATITIDTNFNNSFTVGFKLRF